MEVVFNTEDGIRTETGVTDCRHNEGHRYTLSTEDGSITVEGVLIGVKTYWKNAGFGQPDSKVCAVKLETEDRVDIPTKPLARGSSLSDDVWEYEHGFNFGNPEVEISDGSCILRNVNGFFSVSAETDDESSPHKLYEGEGEVTVPSSVSEEYTASFNSAWTTFPIEGRVVRVTEYRESTSERVEPSEYNETDISWAF